VRVIQGPNGLDTVENTCKEGTRCGFAHSKEEVLFHPLIFKASLCEEHTSNAGNNKNSRSAKKNKCHRYYCPFAHGPEELRPSTLKQEEIENCLRKMEIFPSDICCHVCTRSWLDTTKHALQANEISGLPAGALGFDVPPGVSPMLWGQTKTAQSPIGPQAFDVLSTVPNAVGLKQPKDIFGSLKPEGKLPSPIQKPRDDMYSSLFAPESSLFSGDSLFSQGRDLNPHFQDAQLADLKGPAYIPLPDSGYSGGWGADVGLKEDWMSNAMGQLGAGPNPNFWAAPGSKDALRLKYYQQAEAHRIQREQLLQRAAEEEKSAAFHESLGMEAYLAMAERERQQKQM